MRDWECELRINFKLRDEYSRKRKFEKRDNLEDNTKEQVKRMWLRLHTS